MDRPSRGNAEQERDGAEPQLNPKSGPNSGDSFTDQIVQQLPQAVYATDVRGRITFFNRAAAEMWGVIPQLGANEFNGIWKLYRPDGAPLAQDQGPVALALRHGSAAGAFEAIGERCDGRRIPFVAFPAPLRDHQGRVVGVVNLLIGRTDQPVVAQAAQRLAAIIESSDDAIIAKDMNGVITDWNAGAERLFGYRADEAIGRPVAMLIPPDRNNEEPDILARLRRGERIDHYETIRQRKDGSLIDISLSVSPLKDAFGCVVGASKIARDITARRRAEEQQGFLLREMNHRIKNLFTLAASLVSLSARSATSAKELAVAASHRLGALARAQALAIPQITDPGQAERQTTLHELIEAVMAPYQDAEHARIEISCCEVPIKHEVVTGFALILNEFVTNAAKYGALSAPSGRVEVHCQLQDERLRIRWSEFGGAPVDPPAADGFGSRLVKATVEDQLGGEISREWRREGLTIEIELPADRIRAASA